MVLGPIISAGANLVSGFLGSNSARDAQRASAAQALRQEKLQKEFAQKGIQWKVDDAKAAGIHPLYALGASTATYSPVTVGSTADTSLATGVANMGQDLSRAINSTRTAGQREDAFTSTAKALQLQKAGLENELLGAQIAKLRATSNPPMPTLDQGPVPQASKFEERPKLMMGGFPISTDPNSSNADDYTKRWGEFIGDTIAGPMVAWNDYMNTSGGGVRPNPIFHMNVRPGSVADRAYRWWSGRSGPYTR